MDRGEERIENAADWDTLRRQARRHRHALLTAVLLTAIALVLP